MERQYLPPYLGAISTVHDSIHSHFPPLRLPVNRQCQKVRRLSAVVLNVTLIFWRDFLNSSDFEAIAAYCSKYSTSLPIILLLGFFTSTSMQVRQSNDL